MTDFSRIEQLFHLTCALPQEQRAAFLLTNEHDPAIRAEVEKLLSNDVGENNPLESTLREALTQSSLVPQIVGRYRILRELGSGGMASVFLAERDIDGRAQQVALKLMSGASTPSLRRKAIRERALLASLNHRGIARLIDGGETDDGTPFLVMEYVDGRPILQFIAKRQLNLRERLSLFRQICDAIEHAHQRLILHLDLKPSNVLVREDGSISLIDFGIGRELDDASDQTRTAAYTPIYAAPEQRAGGAATTTTDVYGAGLLLFEILSDGALSASKRNKHDLEIAKLLSAQTTRRRIGNDLRRVIAHATEQQPSDRYSSIAALRADIDNFLAGRMLSASRQVWWLRLAKFCRRNAWPLAATATLLLLASAFVLQLSQERARARAAEKNALIAQDMQASVLLALSPPGNPQAQAKIKELLHDERQRLGASETDQAFDSTWRSIASTTTVAEIYNLIGDPEPAVKASETALRMIDELDQDAAYDDPALEARALSARAQALNELERQEESQLDFKRMIEIRRSKVPEDELGMVHALIQYANAAIGWNEHTLAEQLLNQAQAIADRNDRIPVEDRVAIAIKFLNSSTYDEDAPISAQARLDSLMVLANAKLKPDSADWTDVWGVVSTFHYRYGRYDEALEYLDRALQRSRAAYGERSVITANYLSFRAALLNDLGRHQEALDAFDALRTTQASISPGKTALLAKIDGQRGAVLLELGDYAKAAEASAAAVQGLPESNPTFQRWRAISLSNLAKAHSHLGRHQEAVAAADQLMASLDALPLSAMDRAMARMSLSTIWLNAGRLDRVQTALDEAEASFRKLLPAEHPLFNSVATQRAALAKARSERIPRKSASYKPSSDRKLGTN